MENFTKSSKARYTINAFITNNMLPNFLIHKYLQIKNALFGGLKETIKFPHLEGIKLAIKNIVPSSELRIA
jgi:hypothetical protein